ncbi:hypothetical protein VFPPC_04722 [Pochonia chlamydosporia 170]|uniref:Uncharacterized protein n=1 Tax=Pochonia chlamydosporia 170 TaxID=1380566 RepID=A0A179FTN4_METCM|nr:hypothetical protein VFPPC_04722 [Pochonia chlamydosporia 170]OAQ68491.2 hypothetical protein VFPPC_04722 [Pochonia chlamydosporia 170]
MKTTLALILCTAASFVTAGIVITPIKDNQIVAKTSGDCFFGVVTPQGFRNETRPVALMDWELRKRGKN